VNVIGWCGSASVLTFQRPIRRKSPHVGNLHYRHQPGYRLEVKTAGSAVSVQAKLRSSAWWSVNFSFLGWNGQGNWPFGSAADAEKNPDEFGRSCGVGGSFLHCGRRKRDTDVGSIREPRRTSAPEFGASIVRKLEVTRRATALGSRWKTST
jgi:hypothetical protein